MRAEILSDLSKNPSDRFANPSVSLRLPPPLLGEARRGCGEARGTAILYIIRVRVREFLRTC